MVVMRINILNRFIHLPGILIPSGKGKHPLLMYKNQTYTYKVMSNSGVLWHCSRRMRTGCKAFIRSLPDRIDIIKMVNDTHCHTPKLICKPVSPSVVQVVRRWIESRNPNPHSNILLWSHRSNVLILTEIKWMARVERLMERFYSGCQVLFFKITNEMVKVAHVWDIVF